MTGLVTRMAKVQGRDGVRYSLFVPGNDGIDFEACTDADPDRVRLFEKTLHRIADTPTDPVTLALVMIQAMAIGDLANSIATAGDQQGHAEYATKSHMRGWAADIVGHVKTTISLLQPRPQEKEVA